jgi:hypothetical protein
MYVCRSIARQQLFSTGLHIWHFATFCSSIGNTLRKPSCSQCIVIRRADRHGSLYAARAKSLRSAFPIEEPSSKCATLRTLRRLRVIPKSRDPKLEEHSDNHNKTHRIGESGVGWVRNLASSLSVSLLIVFSFKTDQNVWIDGGYKKCRSIRMPSIQFSDCERFSENNK